MKYSNAHKTSTLPDIVNMYSYAGFLVYEKMVESLCGLSMRCVACCISKKQLCFSCNLFKHGCQFRLYFATWVVRTNPPAFFPLFPLPAAMNIKCLTHLMPGSHNTSVAWLLFCLWQHNNKRLTSRFRSFALTPKETKCNGKQSCI